MTPSALWIWTAAQASPRNAVGLFRRRLRLAAKPISLVLHLCADARYRVSVNGVVAAHGPARGYPGHLEYDSVDLAPFLGAGDQVITVEVAHPGVETFETAPSRPGFIAWGDGAVDLATPGAWEAAEGTAWDADAPRFSFAQGPTEICDHRRLPKAGDWRSPATVDAAAWGPLSPRSIPALGLDILEPVTAPLVARLQPEVRIGCQVVRDPRVQGRQRTPYAVGLHSDSAQAVDLLAFWGPHWCNGEPLTMSDDPLRGNCQRTTLRLRAGWNLLYGEPEVMDEVWPLLLAVPEGRGLIFEALKIAPAMSCESSPAAKGLVPLGRHDLPALAWREVVSGLDEIPARRCAWEIPAGPEADAIADDGSITLGPGEWAVVADLGVEFLGHPRVDLIAPAGTTLDLSTGERRRSDGMLGLNRGHWMMNEVDHHVLAEGASSVECLHHRGGRWLQIIVRTSGPCRILRVGVRATVLPIPAGGSFRCSEPALDWLWETGVATLRACAEDALVDCPWRERGAYVGDILVQGRVLRLLDADPAMVRRSIRMFADGQHADGQIPDVAPSWGYHPLLDYSLLWIALLDEYVARHDDVALIAELWPAVERVLASPVWHEAASGLWSITGRVFVDWTVPGEARRGESGPVNVLRCKALGSAATLAARGGLAARASALRDEAQRVRGLVRQRLYLPGEHRFLDGWDEGPVASRGMHTTVLALWADLVDADELPAVLKVLEAGVNDHGHGVVGTLDCFFTTFLLDVLYTHGRVATAERVMIDRYAAMRVAGAWTLWETFAGKDSLCHAWSAGPLHHLIGATLGVRQDPQHPQRVIIAPQAETLTWAEGTWPHARGPITVRWECRGDQLLVSVRAPAGIEVSIQPRGRLATRTLTLSTAVG